jgi:hypothetical protein
MPFLFVEYGYGACPEATARFSSFGQLAAWILEA